MSPPPQCPLYDMFRNNSNKYPRQKTEARNIIVVCNTAETMSWVGRAWIDFKFIRLFLITMEFIFTSTGGHSSL